MMSLGGNSANFISKLCSNRSQNLRKNGTSSYCCLKKLLMQMLKGTYMNPFEG